MRSEATVLDLVGFIYDAAGDASRWPAFLDRLGHVLKARSLSLHVQDVRTQAGNASAAIGIDAGFQCSYGAYYAARNVYYIRGKHLLRPGHVCESRVLCYDQESFRSEFRNDWMMPQRLGDALNAIILREDSSLASAHAAPSTCRPASSPDHQPGNRE